MTVTPETFTASLISLRALLDQHGHDQWARWVDRTLTYLAMRDPYAAVFWLQAYGGTGSITDVTLPHPDAHEVMAGLRDRCHQLATGLRDRAVATPAQPKV